MIRRTIHKKEVGAILCTDFHLQEGQPVCRLDNFPKAIWRKLDYISELQKKYDCPVLHAGDLFDHWKPSPNLLRETILHLPKQFCTIYGQHDMPQHNLKLVDKCGVNVLEADGTLTVLPGAHWGQHPKESSIIIQNRNILVWHKMNYRGAKPYPGCKDLSARALLKKYSQYDLIVTGDNHKTFIERDEDRILVNPGSLMRMDADQEEHRPCIILWYPKDNSIAMHYLPVEENVISREHIDLKKKRDKRIDNFVNELNANWQIEASFEDNLEQFKKKNKLNSKTMEIIYKAIEQDEKKKPN